MKKIVSFGDSFIFGNEQANNQDGSLGWPGRIAKSLDVDYTTMAVAGCGNEHIAQQVFSYFSLHSPQNVLAVINWTWSMRWDMNLMHKQSWITLGPTCVPDRLKSLISEQEAQKLIDFYQCYCANNVIWNQQRSLMAIYAVQSFLKQNNIACIQTYMDQSIWLMTMDRLEHYDAVRADSWPEVSSIFDLENLPESILDEVRALYDLMQPPGYIRTMQKLTWDQLTSFDGLDFLSWSRQHGHEITELLHPLESAHQAAADYWMDTYRLLCA